MSKFARRIKKGSVKMHFTSVIRRSNKSKTLIKKKDIFLTNQDAKNKFEINIINRAEFFIRNKITDKEKREVDKLRFVKS